MEYDFTPRTDTNGSVCMCDENKKCSPEFQNVLAHRIKHWPPIHPFNYPLEPKSYKVLSGRRRIDAFNLPILNLPPGKYLKLFVAVAVGIRIRLLSEVSGLLLLETYLCLIVLTFFSDVALACHVDPENASTLESLG